MAQTADQRKAMFAKQNLRTLPNIQLQQGIDDRKKLPKDIIENLIREKVRRSGKDTCGVCGTEFKDKGACRVCDAEDERRATNWSTMTQEQRERFFRRHGLENDFAVTTQAKLPFNKLTQHWQEELKRDGFGK